MDRLIGILEHELDMCDIKATVYIKATMYKILDKLHTGIMRDANLVNASSCLDNFDSNDPDNINKLSHLVTNVPKWVKADQKKLIIAAKEELTRLGKGWRWDAASYAIPDPNKMKIIVDEYSVSIDNNAISVCLYFYVVPKNIDLDDYDSPEDKFPHFSVNYDRRGWTGNCEWDQYDNEWFDYNYSK